MANFNDAEITSLYVSATSAPGIQDEAPNAPGGGDYDVTVEMVAGGALATQKYTLLTTAINVSDGTGDPALKPAAPLNGVAEFGVAPDWTGGPTTFTFSQAVTIPLTAGAGKGDVYQYTAALVSSTGQVVSTQQSDLFVLQ
jgi:hypothetical protein